jgi:hypothetical protein
LPNLLGGAGLGHAAGIEIASGGAGPKILRDFYARARGEVHDGQSPASAAAARFGRFDNSGDAPPLGATPRDEVFKQRAFFGADRAADRQNGSLEVHASAPCRSPPDRSA